MKVKEIMNSPVETINSEAMITKAAEKMASLDVGVLPVIKDDEVVGVITDRDIIIRVLAEKLDPQNTMAGQAMSADSVCCSEDTDIEEAIKMMEEKQVRRLLVLSDDNTITGILSTGDIVRKLSDEHLVYEVLGKICEPSHT